MNIVPAKIFKGDKIIWGIILILSIVSLLAVYSSTGTLVFRNQETSLFYYLLRHGGLLIAGIIIILFFQNIPVSFYNRISVLLILITIPLWFILYLKELTLTKPIAG